MNPFAKGIVSTLSGSESRTILNVISSFLNCESFSFFFKASGDHLPLKVG